MLSVAHKYRKLKEKFGQTPDVLRETLNIDTLRSMTFF